MSQWTLVYEGFDPQQEALREALCTLGNGYFATRGAAEEAHADDVHYPGTYLAGGYNRLETEIAGRTIVNEDLVNFPNWLPLTFRLEDGDWFRPSSVEILSYRQELHLRAGVLTRSVRFKDKRDRVSTVVSRRLVHMGDPHLAAIQYSITAENWSGPVRVKSALDGSVINAGVKRYRELNSRHLETVAMDTVGDDGICLLVQTNQSKVQVAEAARTQVFRDDQLMQATTQTRKDAGLVEQELAFEVEAGRPVKIEKIVALYTSRDPGVTDCLLEASRAIGRCGRFQDLLEAHSKAWRSLWRRCDIQSDLARRAPSSEQMLLRLHTFHLLQTASPNTVGLDVSVPARGLHGEAYRGHIFWDELFVLPFYNRCFPEITRSLLLYRYRRLDSARAYAQQWGYEGAMYPWQSGSDGREETQEVHLNPLSGRWLDDNSRLQRHINIAIAYNIWRYFQASGDEEFMASYGAEMVLEIARFWSSIASYNEETQRYEIARVMGPDEYHDEYPGAEKGGIKNNAYTNVMAVWVLERAMDVLRLLPEEPRQTLIDKISLRDEEIERWRYITRRMTIPFHSEGIISQFEGYNELAEFDWAGYREKYHNIERLDRILEAEGDSPSRYKATKQADVCMLFYLLSNEDLRRLFHQLGYDFDDDTFSKNVYYYQPCTSHGSTLSKVVFASLLDRLDRGEARSLFLQALRSDIDDTQGGTTPEGIHLGVMASTVSMVLRNYAGIDTAGETISFQPRLPREFRRIRLRLQHRSQEFELDVDESRLRLAVGKDGIGPVKVAVNGKTHRIQPGSTRNFPS